jgi:L-aminopeptidase/D-esterase-like protein
LGARAGTYKGGIGSASAVSVDGFVVGALAAVNSLGSPLLPGTDVFWAFPLEQDGEFGGRRLKGEFDHDLELPNDMKSPQPGENTTLAIVAIDADVTSVELKRVAIMANDGLARALRPVHTPFDGDIVFAVTTGKRVVGEPRTRNLMRLGSIAADCLSRAVARGVYEAKTLGQMTAYRDVFPRLTQV